MAINKILFCIFYAIHEMPSHQIIRCINTLISILQKLIKCTAKKPKLLLKLYLGIHIFLQLKNNFCNKYKRINSRDITQSTWLIIQYQNLQTNYKLTHINIHSLDIVLYIHHPLIIISQIHYLVVLFLSLVVQMFQPRQNLDSFMIEEH